MKTYFYIYKIYCVITGKPYIGQSNNPIGRINQHENSPYPIGCAIRKYGWENFKIDIFHICRTREEANKLEIEEIRNHNSLCPKGYNLTAGGKTGSPCKITSKKRSDSLKGRTFSHMIGENNPMFGRKRPDVSKRNKENKYGLGKKRFDVSKRNKENNPVSHSIQSEIKRLLTKYKNQIAKLEVKLGLSGIK